MIRDPILVQTMVRSCRTFPMYLGDDRDTGNQNQNRIRISIRIRIRIRFQNQNQTQTQTRRLSVYSSEFQSLSYRCSYPLTNYCHSLTQPFSPHNLLSSLYLFIRASYPPSPPPSQFSPITDSRCRSGKTHTMFGPPGSMDTIHQKLVKEKRKKGPKKKKQPLHSVKVELEEGEQLEFNEEYGLLIRMGREILKQLQLLRETGIQWKLTGQMVELYLGQPKDLMNNNSPCDMDPTTGMWHGVRTFEINTFNDVLLFASFAQSRTTNSTRMNDSSSRSHCAASFLLMKRVIETDKVQINYMNLFDMMGTEKSSGKNNARTESASSQSTHSTMEGWEGISANFTMMHLCQTIVVISDEIDSVLAGKKKITSKGSAGTATVINTKL
eukprot:TRINITY_DN10732_c0_g1_i5.p1 TRINITY_DN10732_c0_g1~~TRINITY_DN10732_c0_g1_i5.p1  ORF type:complete len:383 (+),score=72.43 TRINITY_DN10732_c0_g1_i5:338-1486(+)